MLGNISLEQRCCHEGRFSSFFLKPVAGKGIGVAACQWSIMAWSLGRFVDHCTMREKEGRAVEAQADQVKERGNVIDAVEGK